MGSGAIEVLSVEAAKRLSPHTHPWPCLHWVRSGVYKERDRNLLHRIPKGSLLFKAAGHEHENLFDEGPAEYLRLRVPPGCVPRDVPAATALSAHQPLLGPWMAALWMESKTGDSEADLTAQCVIADALGLALGRREATTSAADRAAVGAAEYLRSSRCERPSFARIASELNVRRETLARAFHRRFGVTMGRYLRQARTTRALVEIDAGGRLAEVALNCGFSDQAHLSRVFKSIVGVSPSAWRRRTS